MNVTYVGRFRGAERETETDIKMAFEALGHTVNPIEETDTSDVGLRDAALNSDFLLWTGCADPGRRTPTLEGTLHTLKLLAQKRVPSVGYHLDTWWPVARGGRPWWTHPLFRMGTFFTPDMNYDVEWVMSGVNARWLPPGVRHTIPERPGIVDPGFVCDVGFTGGDGRQSYRHPEWPYRRELVDQLRAMCRRNKWAFKNPGGSDPVVKGDRLTDFYQSATVTVGDSLCPFREKSRYWSNRHVETTARGGLIIMPQIDRLDVDYNGLLPMYPWGDWQQLETTIGYYLEEGGSNRATRAECQKITGVDHTYIQRVNTILEAVS